MTLTDALNFKKVYATSDDSLKVFKKNARSYLVFKNNDYVCTLRSGIEANHFYNSFK